jgi:tetratricopeptide (TPR) repeat protein
MIRTIIARTCPSRRRAPALGFGLLLFLLLAPPAAAQFGRLDGQVLNVDGKPWADVTVTMKSDQGQTFEVKTDKNGRFSQGGLRTGTWTLSFAYPGQTINYTHRTRVTAGQTDPVVINFKDLLEKQASAREEMKKQEEERGKFENMKTHFDAGRAALDQARTMQAELSKAPPDQRAGMTQQIAALRETAIAEFVAAEKAAGEKESSLHTVLANLGLAYEHSGKYAEAADAFQRAINLKPDETNYYVGLGNSLAKQGKVAEAGAACDKVAAIQPGNAATCWRNLGIVLYNLGNHKDAVEPLKKATQLDPNNGQGWYLLGASLVGTLTTRQEGDKTIYVLAPGTLEAYQKCVEVDGNGPYGAQCKEGLAQLEAIGAGTPTKLKVTKKRP